MRLTSGGAAVLALAGLAMAAVAALAQPAGGDPQAGADVFNDHCTDCHVLSGVGQGPDLIGVVGRKAASLPGYPYSDALKAAGLTWTPANLDRFLQGPKQMVPGTAMSEIVSDPTQRRNLIAYLASLKK